MQGDTDTCPFPPPRCPDLTPDDPFDERPRAHAHGCGELGLALDKHLAGCPIKISERDFIMWARAGATPDQESEWALREALLNMEVREVRAAAFDGRASTRQICALAAQCGAAESMAWNDMIRVLHPELPVPDLPERPMYEKALVWGTAGDGIQYAY